MTTDLDRPYDTVLARAEAAEQENRQLRNEVERLQRLVDQREVWVAQAAEAKTLAAPQIDPNWADLLDEEQ